MRWVAMAAVALAVTGCGARHARLVVSADGRAVLADAYDGTLDRNWSCGSLRAAYRRLPEDPPVYSPLPALIGDAAGKACDATLATVDVGTSERAVTVALGVPDRSPRCRLYRWPPGSGSVDGARICFRSGRVARIQTAVHG